MSTATSYVTNSSANQQRVTPHSMLSTVLVTGNPTTPTIPVNATIAIIMSASAVVVCVVVGAVLVTKRRLDSKKLCCKLLAL